MRQNVVAVHAKLPRRLLRNVRLLRVQLPETLPEKPRLLNLRPAHHAPPARRSKARVALPAQHMPRRLDVNWMPRSLQDPRKYTRIEVPRKIGTANANVIDKRTGGAIY